MIEELVFTSARRGLQVGKTGFCTVASTPGMAANLARLLESLSGYRHLWEPGTSQADQNPVVYSHLKSKIGGRKYDIISRIADAGLDFSHRSNKLAHHFAFSETRSVNFGPADLLITSQSFFTNWDGEARKLRPRIPTVNAATPQPCTTWEQTVGDAGLAADVIEAVQKRRQVYLIVNPDTPMLAMVHEALSLLPLDKQWSITFSTFFTKLPSSVQCDIRCIMADSPEVAPARRSQSNLILDLTTPLPASTSKWADAARNGTLIGQPASKRAAVDTSSVATAAAGAANSFPDQTSGGDDQGLTDIGYGTDLIDDESDGYALAAPNLPPKLAHASRQRRGWNTLAPPELAVKQKKRSKLRWIAIPLLLLALLMAAGGGTYCFYKPFQKWCNNRGSKIIAMFNGTVTKTVDDKSAGNKAKPTDITSPQSDEQKLPDNEIKQKRQSLRDCIDQDRLGEARKQWNALPDDLRSRENFKALERKLAQKEAAAEKQKRFEQQFAELTEKINSDAPLDFKIDKQLEGLKKAFGEMEGAEGKHDELKKLLKEKRNERQTVRDEELNQLIEEFLQTRGKPDIDNLPLADCRSLKKKLTPMRDKVQNLWENRDDKTDGLLHFSKATIETAEGKIESAEDFVVELEKRIANLEKREKNQLKSDEINPVQLLKHLVDFGKYETGTLFEVKRSVDNFGISFKVEQVEQKVGLTDEFSIHIVQDAKNGNRWNIYDSESFNEWKTDEKKIFATLYLVADEKEKKTRLEISRVKDGDMHNAVFRKLVNKSSLAIVCGDGVEKKINLAPMTTTDVTIATSAKGEKKLWGGTENTEIAQILTAKEIDVELVYPTDRVDLLNRSLTRTQPLVIQIKLNQFGKYKTAIPETAQLKLQIKDKTLIAYWTFTGKCSEKILGYDLIFSFEDVGNEKGPYTNVLKKRFKEFITKPAEKEIDNIKQRIASGKDMNHLATDIRRLGILENGLKRLKPEINGLPTSTGFRDKIVIPLKLVGREYEAILNLEITKPD